MRAMLLHSLAPLADRTEPLTLEQRPDPRSGPGEVLIDVSACGVCHTELDEIEGRTPPPRLPVILGHQVVGRVAELGEGTDGLEIGQRVGVAWIFSSCGKCEYCRSGRENLCAEFRATGRDADGGYAERMVVPAGSAYPIPDLFDDAEAAPLLCAGAIGYRSLRLAGLEDGRSLGLTGFGASGHLVLKMARHLYPNSEVFVFARKEHEREFARSLGAVWTGGTSDAPPAPLHAVIDTTPAWLPLSEALKWLAPGGRLVINAIRKEDGDRQVLLDLDYAKQLWQEKEVKSVANITRADVREFLELAAEIPIRPKVETYPLEEANRALLDLKRGGTRGAKVLEIG